MAKFCNKCGTPLEDGKCPNCDKEKKKEIEPEKKVEKKVQREVEEQEEKEEKSEVADNLLSEYVDILKGMFTKPVSTLKNYITEKNFPIGIGSIVVCAILFGILIEVLLGRIFNSIGLNLSMINNMINQINTLIAKEGITIISIPTLEGTGIKLGLMFAVASFVIAGVIYVMHTVIFKKKLDFKKIITMIGIVEIPFSLFLLVSIILSFIHYALGIIFVILAFAYLLVQFHQGVLAITRIDKTKTVYTIAVCILLAIIAFILSFVIIIVCASLATLIGTYQDTVTTIENNWGSMGL